MLAKVGTVKQSGHKALRRLAHHYRVGLGQPLQTGRDVGSVTERQVFTFGAAADSEPVGTSANFKRSTSPRSNSAATTMLATAAFKPFALISASALSIATGPAILRNVSFSP